MIKQDSGKHIVKHVSFTTTEPDHTADDFSRFDAYVKKHIKVIPGVHGAVLLSFTSESDGSITHIKIEKGLTKAADEEAVRLLKSYGKWPPMTDDGKFISSKLTLAVTFK